MAGVAAQAVALVDTIPAAGSADSAAAIPAAAEHPVTGRRGAASFELLAFSVHLRLIAESFLWNVQLVNRKNAALFGREAITQKWAGRKLTARS